MSIDAGRLQSVRHFTGSANFSGWFAGTNTDRAAAQSRAIRIDWRHRASVG